MGLYVVTADAEGRPMCPWDEEPVKTEGEFCSSECWEEFHYQLEAMGVMMADMNYLDLYAQPWYSELH